jgi:chromosomal replication initiator protein
MDSQELWEATLGEIELNLSKANFNTWFKNTRICSYERGVMVISVPNVFNKEWLEKKYHDLIVQALQNVSGKITKVKFIIQSEPQPAPSVQARAALPQVAPDKTSARLPQAQLSLNQGAPSPSLGKSLNPKYSFENFIVGPFNELAHAAALSVANNLGQKFNPLFIYGGVGLGKTHLLQAIGNLVVQKSPDVKIKYLPCEKFTSELIHSIRHQKVEDFKLGFQQTNLLIVDDIQFLAGKEKTQEEFFHTFNALYENNSQIVLSSDRPPRSIPTLEARLRSRFEGGMMADIGTPDYETRFAILKQKCDAKDFVIADHILERIASQIKPSIRELEGCLNRIMAMYELSQNLSAEKIDQVIKEYSLGSRKIPTTDKIIQMVAEHFDLKKEGLLQKNRKKEVAFPRQVVMFLLREELDQSFPEIGRKLGDRDHTTAMYGYKKIRQHLEANEEFQQEIDLIREKIYNY